MLVKSSMQELADLNFAKININYAVINTEG